MFNTFAPVAPAGLLRFDTSCPSPGTARVAVTGEIDDATVAAIREFQKRFMSNLHPRSRVSPGILRILVRPRRLAARGESLPAFVERRIPSGFFAQDPEYSRYSGPSTHRHTGAALDSVLA